MEVRFLHITQSAKIVSVDCDNLGMCSVIPRESLGKLYKMLYSKTL